MVFGKKVFDLRAISSSNSGDASKVFTIPSVGGNGDGGVPCIYIPPSHTPLYEYFRIKTI